jgi:CRISPR/Cas system CSM-associated protein Csm5 (group 7 of RAMP superfamily)
LAEWFDKVEPTAADVQRIVRFYRQLLDFDLAPNQAFMQIGWGAGWDGKTFWTHLQQDTPLFEQLIKDFSLQRKSREAPPRRLGDPFPSSRRVVVTARQGAFAPAAPLGWVLVELEKMR